MRPSMSCAVLWWDLTLAIVLAIRGGGEPSLEYLLIGRCLCSSYQHWMCSSFYWSLLFYF